VLKITRLSHKGRDLTIKLEGELLGAWVSAVRDVCAGRGRRPRRLDLAAVTYVDAAGVQLLRDLIADGVEIAACSSFVGELLRL
jgi:anti-anti-sigma regulatory factor